MINLHYRIIKVKVKLLNEYEAYIKLSKNDLFCAD
jgi:hypothetical protein